MFPKCRPGQENDCVKLRIGAAAVVVSVRDPIGPWGIVDRGQVSRKMPHLPCY